MAAKSIIDTRVFDLESRLEETSLKLSDLTTMATLVTSLLDIESILSVAMEMAVRMAGGEVGAILIEEDDELVSRITWGVDDALVKSIRYKDGEDVATFAFNKQTPVVDNAYDFHVEHGPRIFTQPTCHHRPEVYGGLQESRAAALLKSFFAAKRRKNA